MAFAALEKFFSTVQSDEAQEAFALNVAPLLFQDLPIVRYIIDHLPDRPSLCLLRYLRRSATNSADTPVIDHALLPALYDHLSLAWSEHNAPLVRRLVSVLEEWKCDTTPFFTRALKDVDAERIDLLADLCTFPHEEIVRLCGSQSTTAVRIAVIRSTLTEEAAAEVVRDLLSNGLWEDALMALVRFPHLLPFHSWTSEGWQLLRRALLSHDPRTQKPARYIVEHLISAEKKNVKNADQWEWFWAVFEATQLYTVHSMKEKWAQLESLVEKSLALAAHEKKNEDGVEIPTDMGRSWVEILLILCITHRNDSVRKFAVESIVKKQTWDLSAKFLFDYLLPATTEVSLYKEKSFETNLKAFFTGNPNCDASRLWDFTAYQFRRALHFTPLRVLCEITQEIVGKKNTATQWTPDQFREAVYAIEVGLRDIPRATRHMLACAVMTLFPGSKELPIGTLRMIGGLPTDVVDQCKEHIARIAHHVFPHCSKKKSRVGIWEKLLQSKEPNELALPSSAFLVTALCRLEWADPSPEGEERALIRDFLKNVYSKPYLAREAIQHALLAFNILTDMGDNKGDDGDEDYFRDCHSAIMDYAAVALADSTRVYVDAGLLFTALGRMSGASSALTAVATACLESESAEKRVIALGLSRFLPMPVPNAASFRFQPEPIALLPLVNNGPYGTEIEEAWGARTLRDRFCPVRLFQEGFFSCENARDQLAFCEWVRWQNVDDCKTLIGALGDMCDPEVIFAAQALQRCSWAECDVEDLKAVAVAVRSFISTVSRKGMTPTVLSSCCMMAFNPESLAAEARLFPNGQGPFHALFEDVLVLGEQQVNVARACVFPLLHALRPSECPPCYIKSIGRILIYREHVIEDGAQPRSLTQALICESSLNTQSQCITESVVQSSAFVRISTLAYLDALGDAPIVKEVALELLSRLESISRDIRSSQQKGLKGKQKEIEKWIETPLPLSTQHREQLRAWQALLVLVPKVMVDKDFVDAVFVHIHRNQLPDVRDYQELVAMHLAYRQPTLVLPHILEELRNIHSVAQVTASFIHILGFAMKLDIDKRDALDVLVPHLTSNFSFVRAMAQFVFYTAIDSDTNSTGNVAENETSWIASLPSSHEEIYRMLRDNKECIKMRKRLNFLSDLWDPTASSRLDVLAWSRLVPAPKDQAFEDFVEFRPTEIVISTIKEAIHYEMAVIWDRNIDFSNQDSLSFLKRDDLLKDTVEVAEQPGNQPTPMRAMCQRKFDPLGHEVEKIDELFRYSRDMMGTRKRRDLIVVASFINKAPNLAGLCRTCEVFNARALCIPNKKVLLDTNFTSMSVTAEKWLPIWEVPPKDLVPFLRNLRRKEGYTIVGVEQTHQSQILGQFEFPEKTCLLLGAEKEGLSADIIGECDVCVEIPQEGNVRSLNVHVTGAMCVWECARQIACSKLS